MGGRSRRGLLGRVVLVRRGRRWGVLVAVLLLRRRSLRGVGVGRLLLPRGMCGRGSCDGCGGRGRRRRWERPRGGWREPMGRASWFILFSWEFLDVLDGLILLRNVIYVTNAALEFWIFDTKRASNLCDRPFRIQCCQMRRCQMRRCQSKTKSRQFFLCSWSLTIIGPGG